MSRRISISCAITNTDILQDTLEGMGLSFQHPGLNVFRFTVSMDGYSLLRGGLTLLKSDSDDTFQATFDEDCVRSKLLYRTILQNYLKHYYLWQATLQGDQIVSCRVSDGVEQDPLITRGDIVIQAIKG